MALGRNSTGMCICESGLFHFTQLGGQPKTQSHYGGGIAPADLVDAVKKHSLDMLTRAHSWPPARQMSGHGGVRCGVQNTGPNGLLSRGQIWG